MRHTLQAQCRKWMLRHTAVRDQKILVPGCYPIERTNLRAYVCRVELREAHTVDLAVRAIAHGQMSHVIERVGLVRHECAWKIHEQRGAGWCSCQARIHAHQKAVWRECVVE